MAQSATISGLFGGYTHSLVVSELSQDAKANTTRVRIVYGVRRETRQEWGAYTGLNNVTFNAVVNGVTHSENPNFDFRDYSYKTMIDTEQTIEHTADGTKTINISFSSNALEGSVQFVASSKSGTFTLDPLNVSRATQFQTTRPNPISEGGALTITFNPDDPAYTHRLRWSVDDAAPTTITSSATSPYVWTIPTMLGGSSQKIIELYLDTYSGDTLLGTDTHEIVVRPVPEYPQIGEGTPYDLRFRRMVLDGGNWEPRESIPFLRASFTDTFSATAVCSLTVSEQLYQTDLENAVVSVEVFDGAQWISPDLRFVLGRVEEDPTDEALTVTYTGTSYVDFVLSKGVIDREREFKSTTPGDILLGELQRAQRRGWGPLIGIDHTAAKTSLGTNWKYSDVSMTLQTDTPFLQILEGMVKDVLLEYRTTYKNNKGYLRMMNPGTGSDWTIAGADPIVNLSTIAVNRVADSAPIRKDYGGMLTRVRVRGDEVSRTRENGALVNPMFGHLEGSVQATDVKNTGRLDRLGDATLQSFAAAAVERTFSYDLSSNQTPAAVLPYRTFRPGDWVLAPGDNGGVPVRSRVAQIAITRDNNTTKATVTVGDMIPSGVAATARRLTQQSSGAIAGGSLRAPSPLASAIPSEPTGLASVVDGFWDTKGAPKANVELSWNRVTTSVEGSSLNVDLYEIWQRAQLGSPWVLAGVSDTTNFVVGPLDINQDLDLRVKARSTGGVYGVDSDFLTVTTVAPDEYLAAPSAPILYADALGTVTIKWTGQIGGATPPLWFSYVRAEISNASDGAYSAAGQQLTSAGETNVANVGAGTWWFRLVGYDALGRPGAASTPVSILVDPVLADLRKPKAPTGLGATSTGYWSGPNPMSGVDAAWTAVTQAEDNTAQTIDLYELWGRLTTETNFRLLASSATNSVYAAPLGPLGSTYVIKVRAMGSNTVWSDFSSTTTVTIVGPTVAMAAPSTPTLSSGFGLISVTWDGLIGGVAPPAQFANVFAEMSTTSEGTYSKTGNPLTRDSRQLTITGVAAGQTRWVRLRAVDTNGNITAPSTAVSITVDSVDLGDLDSSVNTAITNAQNAATAAQNAANTAQNTANTAQTTADGKNTVWYQTTAPAGTSHVVGDTWFDTDDSNRIYRWSGSAWVDAPLGSSALSSEINDSINEALNISNAVDLRGSDLVTNGDGALGDSTNWPASLTRNPADRPPGTYASFETALTASGGSAFLSDIIPINPAKKYLASVWARQTVAGVTSRFYLALQPHDADGLPMSPVHYMEQTGTRTTLAAPLNPGDTTIQLTSSANWNNAAGASTHLRTVIVWNYVDSSGKAWAAGEYSRNVVLNAYADGGINTGTHVITLTNPWSGTAAPAGTPISNGSSGGSFMYPVSNASAPETWTNFQGSLVGGVLPVPSPLAASTSFPIATAGVKVGLLTNYSASANSRQRFAGLSFSEVGAATVIADSKNRIVFATIAPNTTVGYSAGDVWFQKSGDVIIGQWEFTTAWVAKTIDNAVIANLNAAKINAGTLSADRIGANSITAAKMVAGTITAASGIIADAAITNAKIADGTIQNAKIATLDAAKITTGTLSANRIGANTITADKIAVGDFNNRLSDPDFELGGLGWTLGAQATIATVTDPPLGGSKVLQITANGTIIDVPQASIPVTPGDFWYGEVWVRKISGTDTTGSIGIAANVTGDNGFVTQYPSFQLVEPSAITSNWTKLSGTIEVPDNAARMLFRITVRNDVSDGVYQFDSAMLRRMSQGELLVDGSILAGKLAANSVAAENIEAGAVTAGKIAANSITANELAVDSVTANAIEAGSINVDHLEPSLSNTITLSAEQVEILATQVTDAQETADANAANLTQLQTRYSFTPTAAVISQPGSAFKVEISNTQLSFIEGSDVRASLNAGVFDAPKMAAEQLQLTWHIMEDDPSGTVFRRAS